VAGDLHAMIATFQYGWTIFIGSDRRETPWGKPAIQVTFTLFILLETWLVPFEAYLADRFGPALLVLSEGVLMGFPGCCSRGQILLPFSMWPE